MIAFTLRRHRTLLVVMGALTLLFFGWTLYVGHGIEANQAAMRSLGDCPSPGGGYGDGIGRCSDLFSQLVGLESQAGAIRSLLYITPFVLGLGLGVPVAALEYERRTNRLLWTQGVSRTRWFLTTTGVLGSIVLVIALAGAVLSAWWYPHAAVNVSIHPRFTVGFDIDGIVSISYCLFAFALGVAVGAVIRKVTFSLIASSAIVLVVRGFVRAYLRPHYMSPLSVASDPASPAYRSVLAVRDNWFTWSGMRNMPGFHLSSQEMNSVLVSCESNIKTGTPYDPNQCLVGHHIQFIQNYQPPNRYWAFQGIESAVFIALAIGLYLLALWSVKRWRA